jgi:hypothetical protein
MGEWMKARNVTWGDLTERQLLEIQDAMAPTFNSRSATARWVVARMHQIIFTPHILKVVSDAFQELHFSQSMRTNSGVTETPGKPGPISLHPNANGRPRKLDINHQRNAVRAVEAAAAAYRPPFDRGLFLNFNSAARVA